jgi:hypothetical protein
MGIPPFIFQVCSFGYEDYLEKEREGGKVVLCEKHLRLLCFGVKDWTARKQSSILSKIFFLKVYYFTNWMDKKYHTLNVSCASGPSSLHPLSIYKRKMVSSSDQLTSYIKKIVSLFQIIFFTFPFFIPLENVATMFCDVCRICATFTFFVKPLDLTVLQILCSYNIPSI